MSFSETTGPKETRTQERCTEQKRKRFDEKKNTRNENICVHFFLRLGLFFVFLFVRSFFVNFLCANRNKNGEKRKETMNVCMHGEKKRMPLADWHLNKLN